MITPIPTSKHTPTSILHKECPTITKWKRTLTGVAVLLLGSTQAAFTQDNTQTPPLQQVIVVIRHGEDLDEWIKADKKDDRIKSWKEIVPNWPNYMTSAGSFKVSQHGLSKDGEDQAIFMRDNLQRLMKWGNYDFISRVITKKPHGLNELKKDVTPNPFDTIYPFLQLRTSNDTKNPKPDELILIEPGKEETNPLVDKELLALLPDESKKMVNGMLPATGSTLLCWDAEGLWGEAKGEKPNRTRPFDERCILRLFGGHTIGDYIRDKPASAGGGCPEKAARIYVFMKRPDTGPGTTVPQKYDCDVIDMMKRKDGERYFCLVAEIRVNESTQKCVTTEPKSGGLQEIVLPDL